MKNPSLLIIQDLSRETPGSLQSLVPPPQGIYVHWILRPSQKNEFEGLQEGIFHRKVQTNRGLVLWTPLGGWLAVSLFPKELRDALGDRLSKDLLFLEEAHFIGPSGEQPPGDWVTWDSDRKTLQGVLKGRPWSWSEKPGKREVYWASPRENWTNLSGLSLPLLAQGSDRAGPSPLGLSPRARNLIFEKSASRRQLPPDMSPFDAAWFQSLPEHPSSLHHLGGIRERTLVSSMQGITDFRESGQVARFRGGHFQGLEVQETPQQTTGAARAFYTFEGKTWDFKSVSAFSLENEHTWGLRETLQLDGEAFSVPGRLVLDHFFLNDSAEFCLSATLRHPRFKRPGTVGGWGAFEWLILPCSPWEKVQVEVLDPLEQNPVKVLPRSASGGQLRGAGFLFKKKGFSLALVFPQNQNPRPVVLPWRWGKLGGKTGLIINPEGVWGSLPSESVDNWEEHFTFLVRLNPPLVPDLKIPEYERDEFPPAYCRKI